ncbi:MAG: hypothetical protein GY765_07125, partial [bacterium]|nr:hypothetical protein [bacterium]
MGEKEKEKSKNEKVKIQNGNCARWAILKRPVGEKRKKEKITESSLLFFSIFALRAFYIRPLGRLLLFLLFNFAFLLFTFFFSSLKSTALRGRRRHLF